jgi:hypothetical protein
MRVAALVVFFALSPYAIADAPNCKETGLRPDIFTSKEWESLRQESPSSNPVLSEGRYLFNRASKSISPKEMRLSESLSWQQAKKLILLGAVNRLFKDYPGPKLYLGTRSGRVYVTNVDSSDNLWDLTNLVDPCHVFISIWEP